MLHIQKGVRKYCLDIIFIQKVTNIQGRNHDSYITYANYPLANHEYAIIFKFTLMPFIRNLEKIVITIPLLYIWKNMKELVEIM